MHSCCEEWMKEWRERNGKANVAIHSREVSRQRDADVPEVRPRCGPKKVTFFVTAIFSVRSQLTDRRVTVTHTTNESSPPQNRTRRKCEEEETRSAMQAGACDNPLASRTEERLYKVVSIPQ